MGFYKVDRCNKTKQKPASELLAQFNNPLDCLTAHLMLECSEVLAEAKPANLVSLVNRIRTCGLNLNQTWLLHHQRIAFRLCNLEFLALQSKARAILLLCYNRKQLEQYLSHASIRRLLQKAGYEQEDGLDELLIALKQRFADHDRFPHEIGLFIGYPAKDVAAFMGLIKLPLTCQGPWKIYGNPLQSLNLVK